MTFAFTTPRRFDRRTRRKQMRLLKQRVRANPRSKEQSQMRRSFLKSNAFCYAICALILLLAVSDLAGCGGSSAKDQPPNQTPTITYISPNTAVAGDAAFTITINGTNFVAASVVNFGGSAPVTTFVNSTQLTAAIPAVSIASTGTMAVTVTNPAPAGGTSNARNFTITSAVNAVPTINSIYPSCAPAGSLDSLGGGLTVGGQNFVASSVVRWNGTDLPTTLYPNSDGGITAQISASDFAAAGAATVTVFNPGAGGGSSNSLTFTITTGAV